MTKQERVIRYRRILRNIRTKIFEYEDKGKRSKALRIMGKIKKIVTPVRRSFVHYSYSWGE